jgi:hypothetical protein
MMIVTPILLKYSKIMYFMLQSKSMSTYVARTKTNAAAVKLSIRQRA